MSDKRKRMNRDLAKRLGISYQAADNLLKDEERGHACGTRRGAYPSCILGPEHEGNCLPAAPRKQ